MGTFLVNLHVRSESQDQVKDALTKVEATRAFLTQPKDGWISVYETRCCDQDMEWIKQVTQAVSKAAKSHAIAFLIHDSDFLAYWLYDQGKLTDQFNSLPDCFEECSDADRKKLAGKPAKLQAACRTEVTLAQVEQFFARFQSQPNMAETMLEELAKLLGIDSNRIFTDYHGIGTDVTAEEIAAELFKGTADEDNEQAADEGAAESGNTSDSGLSPLVDAILRNDLASVAAMIDEGADVNANVFCGQTALGYAAQAGLAEAVRLLLKSGANVNHRSAVGTMPIFMTVSPEVAQLLVEAGADINAEAFHGVTPLHHFVRIRNVPMVRFLVHAGADLTKKSGMGQNAYEAAQSAGQQFEAAFLRAGVPASNFAAMVAKLPPELAAKFGEQSLRVQADWEQIVELIKPKS